MAEIYTVTADNAYQFKMTPGSLAEEVGQNLMVLLLVMCLHASSIRKRAVKMDCRF